MLLLCLSTVRRYQASAHHVPGATILPSDLPVAMLPSVTTQYSKFPALFNALRIPWFAEHLSKAYCQELLNFLSLAELLGLLSRRSVSTYGALMPILLKAHALPKSWQTLKMVAERVAEVEV